MEAALFVKSHLQLFEIKKLLRPIRKRVGPQLLLPPSKLAMVRNGPYCRCVRIMNKVLGFLNLEISDRLFKKRLKEILIEKCYYSMDEFFDDNSLECENDCL